MKIGNVETISTIAHTSFSLKPFIDLLTKTARFDYIQFWQANTTGNTA